MSRFLEFLSELNTKIDEVIHGVHVKPPESGEFAFSTSSAFTDDALKALDEWHAAENYFNSITDPDLVEYALYELEAARKKYEYLMRKIRYDDAAYTAAESARANYYT